MLVGGIILFRGPNRPPPSQLLLLLLPLLLPLLAS
jgi:hypothetical protein